MQSNAVPLNHSATVGWVVIAETASQPRSLVRGYSQSTYPRRLTLRGYTLASATNIAPALTDSIGKMAIVETRHRVAFALLVIATIIAFVGFLAGVVFAAKPLGVLFPIGLFIWAAVGYAYPRWLAK